MPPNTELEASQKPSLCVHGALPVLFLALRYCHVTRCHQMWSMCRGPDRVGASVSPWPDPQGQRLPPARLPPLGGGWDGGVVWMLFSLLAGTQVSLGGAGRAGGVSVRMAPV